MRDKEMRQLIEQLENYTECWKQFNHFISIARDKKFGPEEESQFLEMKSVLIQQLEMILSQIQEGTPDKDQVLTLVGSAHSLRFLSEMNEAALRQLESQWHKLYINWHSVLGQLKVAQKANASQSFFSRFSRKK